LVPDARVRPDFAAKRLLTDLRRREQFDRSHDISSVLGAK
jgi:hypothetical protein